MCLGRSVYNINATPSIVTKKKIKSNRDITILKNFNQNVKDCRTAGKINRYVSTTIVCRQKQGFVSN